MDFGCDGFINGNSGGDAAGEEDAGNFWVGHEVFACFFCALDEVDDAWGEGDMTPEFDSFLCSKRGEFAGFKNDGITGEEGWDDVTIGDMEGEIESSEDSDWAVGFEACEGGTGAEGLAAVIVGIDGNSDFIDSALDFGESVPAGFADFVGDNDC